MPAKVLLNSYNNYSRKAGKDVYFLLATMEQLTGVIFLIDEDTDLDIIHPNNYYILNDGTCVRHSTLQDDGTMAFAVVPENEIPHYGKEVHEEWKTNNADYFHNLTFLFLDTDEEEKTGPLIYSVSASWEELEALNPRLAASDEEYLYFIALFRSDISYITPTNEDVLLTSDDTLVTHSLLNSREQFALFPNEAQRTRARAFFDKYA